MNIFKRIVDPEGYGYTISDRLKQYISSIAEFFIFLIRPTVYVLKGEVRKKFYDTIEEAFVALPRGGTVIVYDTIVVEKTIQIPDKPLRIIGGIFQSKDDAPIMEMKGKGRTYISRCMFIGGKIIIDVPEVMEQ